MNVRQLTARVPLRANTPGAPDADQVIDVFHRLIRERNTIETDDAIEGSEGSEVSRGHELFHGQLLIDVADYRHVANGPGVLLVAHQAIYSLGPSGLEVAIKRDKPGPAKDKIQDVVSRLVGLAAALEADSSLDVEFELSHLEIAVGDRLLSVDPEALAAEATAALSSQFGQSVASEVRGGDPRGPVAAISRIS